MAAHDHRHSHAPKTFGTAFAIGTALNLGFVADEAIFGILSNSVALVADAGHNLSDVFGLVMAWVASVLARRSPTARYTYGFGQSSILAALANAILLLIATGAIIWAAIDRLFHPQPVASLTVMIVAGIGIAINMGTALLFMRGREHDLNIRGAFLHMVFDAAVSVGVVIAALIISLTGQVWIDPVVSLAIALIIVCGTWGLLRESSQMAMQAAPQKVDVVRIRRFLSDLEGVDAVHDLHVWPLSTTEIACTCHLVMSGGHPGDDFLISTARHLHDDFGIEHTTLQVERGDGGRCELVCDSALPG